MTVSLNHTADIAMRTLGEEDRRKVFAWIDNLKRWEEDSFVRSKAKKLDVKTSENVFVLNTSTDLSILFVLHVDHIELIDIARPASLETVRQAS